MRALCGVVAAFFSDKERPEGDEYSLPLLVPL
jgi:hypothetical protein